MTMKKLIALALFAFAPSAMAFSGIYQCDVRSNMTGISGRAYVTVNANSTLAIYAFANVDGWTTARGYGIGNISGNSFSGMAQHDDESTPFNCSKIEATLSCSMNSTSSMIDNGHTMNCQQVF